MDVQSALMGGALVFFGASAALFVVWLVRTGRKRNRP